MIFDFFRNIRYMFHDMTHDHAELTSLDENIIVYLCISHKTNLANVTIYNVPNNTKTEYKNATENDLFMFINEERL